MNFDPSIHSEIAAQPYPLLFATISGAHLYGFPSPDSDYDLRGVHILPAREVLGLDPGRETIEVSALRDGLEIDISVSPKRSGGFSTRSARAASNRCFTSIACC